MKKCLHFNCLLSNSEITWTTFETKYWANLNQGEIDKRIKKIWQYLKFMLTRTLFKLGTKHWKWWKPVGILLCLSCKIDIHSLSKSTAVITTKYSYSRSSSSCQPSTNATSSTFHFLSSIKLQKNEVFDILCSIDIS